MKDIVITAKRIRRERNFYIVSFVLAFLINIFAVVTYERPWVEIFSQIGYVAVISVAIYILLWIPRLLVLGGVKLFGKKRRR